MFPFDEFVTSNFATIKGGIFVTCFLLAALIQRLIPHQNKTGDDFINWRVNLPLGLFNTVIFAFLCGSCVCVLAEKTQVEGTGLFHLAGMSYLSQVILSVVLLDLVAYVFHRIYHQVPLFWKFHASHHADVVFETSTAIRFHPGELLLSLGVRIVFVWALGIPVLALLIFEGVYIFFNLIEHSDFNLPPALDRKLSRVFITPSLHRLHHSVDRKELNSNFGTILSVWDRLFGSYRTLEANRTISIGLGGPRLSLKETLLLPLRRSGYTATAKPCGRS